jgi:hypothetical protein
MVPRAHAADDDDRVPDPVLFGITGEEVGAPKTWSPRPATETTTVVLPVLKRKS